MLESLNQMQVWNNALVPLRNELKLTRKMEVIEHVRIQNATAIAKFTMTFTSRDGMRNKTNI